MEMVQIQIDIPNPIKQGICFFQEISKKVKL